MRNSIKDPKFAPSKDRRIGFERRQFSYFVCIPERRKIADRRSGIKLSAGDYRGETERIEYAMQVQ